MTLDLSTNQQTFADELAKDTGLNLGVLEAWLRNEEPAESSNGASGANNFLNVGITDNGSYGESNAVWANPVSAANATADWLEGVPIGAGGYTSTGYPGADQKIQAIVSTAKESPAAQISAIQGSGWARGGETALPSLYTDATGGTVTSNVLTPASNPLTGWQPLNLGGSSSTPSSGGTQVLPGGYIKPAGGLFSSLNPFNAIVGVWDSIIGDAKYAGVFILALVIGGYLIMHGLGTSSGGSRPMIVPVPA